MLKTFLPKYSYFLSHHYLNKVVENDSLGLFFFLLIVEEGYFYETEEGK